MNSQPSPASLPPDQFSKLLGSITPAQARDMLVFLSGYSPAGFDAALDHVRRMAAAAKSPANPYASTAGPGEGVQKRPLCGAPRPGRSYTCNAVRPHGGNHVFVSPVTGAVATWPQEPGGHLPQHKGGHPECTLCDEPGHHLHAISRPSPDNAA